MARSARFYLSRLIKNGELTNDKVLDALRKSVAVESRTFAWTIVDVLEDRTTHDGKSYAFLAGKLVKYDPDAVVEVVDEDTRAVRSQPEPNLHRASSLFAFLPDEAVFGHQVVGNHIRASDFRVQVKQLILAYHQHFFVDCELRAVADLARFVTKLGQLDAVTELKARVSPPNPLFGRYWKNLQAYLEDRRLGQLSIKETVRPGESLPTTAPEIARRLEVGAQAAEGDPAPIGDAAVLMAADGYGTAVISGTRQSTPQVVSTEENALQFKLDASVTGPELAAALVREVTRLNTERNLRHK